MKSFLGISNQCLTFILVAIISVLPISIGSVHASSQWQQTIAAAKGQTVYFNAWGGSEQVNDYIIWAASQVKARYGITLKHVKVKDVSTVVSQILAEKTAGRTEKGTVDMVWINGENFRSMKEQGLLYGPFVSGLPSFKFVDPAEKPTTVLDFGEPVDGLEAPWGMAQLVFLYDTEVFAKKGLKHPRNANELLQFARNNKGRVTYPLPPDFMGTTFLKQLLMELTPNPDVLLKPVAESDFKAVTSPLWHYLDALHPFMWRGGRTFPANNTAMTPMLDDGEILLSMSFNPSYASSAIASGELSDTVRTYVHTSGTIGNSHFLAIPFNSHSKAAAQVVINFLLSPRAQAHKADPNVWGDPAVLSMNRLSSRERNYFSELSTGVATLSAQALGKALPEPHNSWVTALEAAWIERYRR